MNVRVVACPGRPHTYLRLLWHLVDAAPQQRLVAVCPGSLPPYAAAWPPPAPAAGPATSSARAAPPRTAARPARATDTSPQAPAAPGWLCADAAARIVQVAVAPGDEVVAQQVLVILEAMKVEMTLRAPRAGKVREVRAEAGCWVQAGQPLVALVDG